MTMSCVALVICTLGASIPPVLNIDSRKVLSNQEDTDEVFDNCSFSNRPARLGWR